MNKDNRGEEWFMFNKIFNNKNNIEYVSDFCCQDCTIKYLEFCDWLYEEYKKNLQNVYDRKLEYLFNTSSKLEVSIRRLKEENEKFENVIELNDIEFNNKKNFEELLEDITSEYQYIKNNKKDESLNDIEEKNLYRYYNRIFSWYKLTPDLLKGAIRNLANNEICFENIDFDKICLKSVNKIRRMSTE